MKLAGGILLAFLLCTPVIGMTAFADTINFDNVDATAGDVPLTSASPYQGFTFNNFSIYTNTPGFPGYNNGIVSGANAAYTYGDALGSPIISTIAATSLFDFTSVALGSGWYDGLNVTFVGLANGAQLFSQTVTANTTGAQTFNFKFDDINELEMFATPTAKTTDPFGCGSSGCSQVTLDNLTVAKAGSPSPTPEPASYLLAGLGIMFVAMFYRSRVSIA